MPQYCRRRLLVAGAFHVDPCVPETPLDQAQFSCRGSLICIRTLPFKVLSWAGCFSSVRYLPPVINLSAATSSAFLSSSFLPSLSFFLSFPLSPLFVFLFLLSSSLLFGLFSLLSPPALLGAYRGPRESPSPHSLAAIAGKVAPITISRPVPSTAKPLPSSYTRAADSPNTLLYPTPCRASKTQRPNAIFAKIPLTASSLPWPPPACDWSPVPRRQSKTRVANAQSCGVPVLRTGVCFSPSRPRSLPFASGLLVMRPLPRRRSLLVESLRYTCRHVNHTTPAIFSNNSSPRR